MPSPKNTDISHDGTQYPNSQPSEKKTTIQRMKHTAMAAKRLIKKDFTPLDDFRGSYDTTIPEVLHKTPYTLQEPMRDASGNSIPPEAVAIHYRDDHNKLHYKFISKSDPIFYKGYIPTSALKEKFGKDAEEITKPSWELPSTYIRKIIELQEMNLIDPYASHDDNAKLLDEYIAEKTLQFHDAVSQDQVVNDMQYHDETVELYTSQYNVPWQQPTLTAKTPAIKKGILSYTDISDVHYSANLTKHAPEIPQSDRSSHGNKYNKQYNSSLGHINSAKQNGDNVILLQSRPLTDNQPASTYYTFDDNTMEEANFIANEIKDDMINAEEHQSPTEENNLSVQGVSLMNDSFSNDDIFQAPTFGDTQKSQGDTMSK